jgi:SAGA-associated factor 29
VYAKDEEVAFKRKVAGGKPDEQDWILGRVVRVIGEGKSRRYEVQDPFPDEGSVNPLFKSSASQMVPIPPEGTALEDYEVGKRVLALYPDTTTFYRAEVKAMLDGGARVQLLFEDEAAGALKIVERRFVLDHKG